MKRFSIAALGFFTVFAAAISLFGGVATAQESKLWAVIKFEKRADMGPVVILPDPNGKTYVIVAFKAKKSTVDGLYMEFDQYENAVDTFELIVEGRLNSYWFYYQEEQFRKQVADGVYGKVFLAMNEK